MTSTGSGRRFVWYDLMTSNPQLAIDFYTRVADVREPVGMVETLGGKLLNGLMEVPGGDLIVQCSDPTGAMFALHSSAR